MRTPVRIKLNLWQRNDRSSARFGRSSATCNTPDTAVYIDRMNKRAQRGFTLYELMITLLIVGVVLTLGIPNLSAFTRNSRITSTVNDFHAAFQVARSEAARAKTNITICASNNSMTAAADCQGNWEDGFILFIDDNGDKKGTPATWFRGIHAEKKAKDKAEPDGFRAHQLHLVQSDFEKSLSADQRAQRDVLELEVMRLRGKKAAMDGEEYYRQLDVLFLKMARIYLPGEG